MFYYMYHGFLLITLRNRKTKDERNIERPEAQSIPKKAQMSPAVALGTSSILSACIWKQNLK